MADHLQQTGMPGFGRAMRCEQISGRGRADTDRERRGCRCDESVHNNGNAAGRCSQKKAAHSGNFEAAEAAENSQRITQAFGVQSQSAPNGVNKGTRSAY